MVPKTSPGLQALALTLGVHREPRFHFHKEQPLDLYERSSIASMERFVVQGKASVALVRVEIMLTFESEGVAGVALFVECPSLDSTARLQWLLCFRCGAPLEAGNDASPSINFEALDNVRARLGCSMLDDGTLLPFLSQINVEKVWGVYCDSREWPQRNSRTGGRVTIINEDAMESNRPFLFKLVHLWETQDDVVSCATPQVA
jgi:hypothetical protein